jgi:energy-coupling factor transporter ATP-binding protein EcfA2
MKRFHLTENYVLINFNASLCDSEIQIVSSKSFEMVLAQYIKDLRKRKDPTILKLKGVRVSTFHDAYKQLLIYDYDHLLKKDTSLSVLLKERQAFYRFTEMFYDQWRKLERFGMILKNRRYPYQSHAQDLITKSDNFNQKILFLYRTIAQNILGREFLTFRQLPAGINANMVLMPHKFSNLPKYQMIQNVHFIQDILTRPPFIIYSKSNKREGLFREIKENPLKKLNINRLHYIVYPIKVGKLIAFVYIHRDFIHHGIALSNLFEPAAFSEYEHINPNLVYIYGVRENEFDCTYYKDTDFIVGIVSRLDKNDYFGYLKKMLLTLHNIYQIDHGQLPIHGAMVRVLLNNGNSKNIAVIGDSGAGKSETLEALRIIGKDYIKDMRIIFDDMGTFFIKNNEVYADGTEIGAFVRLDDLDAGYAYQEMDRAIFLNPDQTNARVILPVSTYDFISLDHKVDVLLYANNYIDTNEGLRYFNALDEAKFTFKAGKRYAKGTTAEVGLVESYFANPFGPVQEQAKTDFLIDQIFAKLFDQNIKVGELYTRLAIKGKEMDGPIEAAKKLLQFLTKEI